MLDKNLINIAASLKERYPNISDFEALQLTLHMEQNEILKRAFVLSATDNYPSGLEAIAIALGYKK